MFNWLTDFDNPKQAEDFAAYAYRLEAAPITMEPVFEAVPDAELPDATTKEE